MYIEYDLRNSFERLFLRNKAFSTIFYLYEASDKNYLHGSYIHSVMVDKNWENWLSNQYEGMNKSLKQAFAHTYS